VTFLRRGALELVGRFRVVEVMITASVTVRWTDCPKSILLPEKMSEGHAVMDYANEMATVYR